jgi:large subunit ribosomal protein L15e
LLLRAYFIPIRFERIFIYNLCFFIFNAGGGTRLADLKGNCYVILMKHLSVMWKRPREGLGEGWKPLLMGLRREPVMSRLGKPTRPDRARSLGYKAKKGHAVVRVRVGKGMRKTPKKGGRRPKASGRFFTPGLSLQAVAEQRVARRFPNLEVLASYHLAEDGSHKWFEVLLLDPSRPEVAGDRERSLGKGSGRAFRGRTPAGRKFRGLTKRGKGTEKARPSAKSRSGRGR